MNPELYQKAAEFCLEVYTKNKSLGTTQYSHFITNINGKKWQVISIAGTNELKDNIRNLNVFWSKKGIKKGSYDAAVEIYEDAKKMIKYLEHLPLLVVGHSKGGATAIAFKRLFGADYCVVFSPARCLRYWCVRTMKNITMFIDPDDPVTEWLGIINFGLPKCKTIKAKKDHLLMSIGDHIMKHWIEFTKKLNGGKKW